MSQRQIVVAGGGAAGFFAAITCAEAAPSAKVILLEKSSHFLSKVRISGGGRCNVTHACFEPRELSRFYPRGGQALLGPFQAFQPADTIEWFESRGVKLKTEADGRMFPITDSSQTIVDCLVQAARRTGVTLRSNCGVERIERETDAGFTLFLNGEERIRCERLLLATGGCRVAAAGDVAVSVGHTLEPPVPSLFTFHVQDSWPRDLAGVSLPAVQASVPALKLSERGPLLLTHQGVSGPVILRLSAWGARVLHSVDYTFTLRLNWLPELEASEVSTRLAALRSAQSARLVVNQPVAPLPARLWEKLVLVSGIARETRWANLSKSAQHHLVEQLTRCEIQVSGKSLNRDEFVTCGGIPLNQIDFKKMESRCCPNLFFAGEVLDIDGLTGGFNFQAAWTTGWIAGRAMASPFGGEPHHHVEPGH